MFSNLLTPINQALPTSWRNAMLVLRRSREFRRAGVVFIHVPKVAGSSVNETIYGRFMGHYTARQVQLFAPRDVRALPSFSLTRNPWDRLVSAWRFARAGRGRGEGVTAGIRNPELYRHPAFESFNRFVLDWLSERDIMRLDGVFRPQSHFLCDAAGNVLVRHLGRLENMEETYLWLAQTLGTPVRFAHRNASGEAVDYRSFYSDQTAMAVANIYRADIARFGYDF